VGAVLGGIIGAAGTLLAQYLGTRNGTSLSLASDRAQLYSRFLAACREAHELIMGVARARPHDWRDVEPLPSKVQPEVQECLRLLQAVRLIGSSKVWQPALETVVALVMLETYARMPTSAGSLEGIQAEYGHSFDVCQTAARQELGLGDLPTRRHSST